MKTLVWTGIGFFVAFVYFFTICLTRAAADTRRANVLAFRKSRRAI